MMKALFLILLLNLATSCSSAPLPATGSSNLINSEDGTFRSELGFKLNSAQTGWVLTAPPKNSKFVISMYVAPEVSNKTKATLTVRLDKMGERQELKRYVNRWIAQYPKFGFEVLGKKQFSNNGQEGYVIDLRSRKAAKQLRQVVYVKNTQAVVLTCRDHIDNFRNSLRSCNKIVRTFEWADVPGLVTDES